MDRSLLGEPLGPASELSYCLPHCWAPAPATGCVAPVTIMSPWGDRAAGQAGETGGQTVSWRDEIRAIAREARISRADELVVFSGAGISQEHPTHAPSGVQLMKSAIKNFFIPQTLDEMSDAYASIRAVTGEPESLFRGRPRLEAVLDVVNDVYGPEALAYLTPYFTARPSNRVHAMLGAHLDQGGRHVTANFDRFVEHVASPHAPEINHFHGEVETDSDALPFGARLGAIEHGFDTTERARLLEPLSSPSTRCIAFIGYSFSDYFDVTPAVVSAIQAGALDDKTVIWLDFDHTLSEPTVVAAEPSDRRGIIGAARARGVAVVAIAGWSGDALFELLSEIGCRLDPAWAAPTQCDADDATLHPTYPASDEQRRAATVRLLSRFGMLGRLPSTRLGLGIADIPASTLADYWWKKGRYERARDSAIAALEPHHPHRDIQALLLHARFDWIEGRLSKAATRTLAAISALDVEAGAPTALRAEALERYGRVAVAARRTPDARLLLLPRMRRRLPDYEHRVNTLLHAREVGGAATSHLRDASETFRAEVLGRRASSEAATVTHRADLMERFSQSESIDAYVDYVRGNANRGSWELPRTNGDWRPSMNDLYDIVGNVADKHRLTLFEPRGLARKQPNPFHAARQVDASEYHRVRMVTRHLLTRLQRTAQDVVRWHAGGTSTTWLRLIRKVARR